MPILSELKRRNVIRVLTAYIVASWLIIQVAETIFPLFGLSDGVVRMVVVLLAIGIIPAAALAWSFELTPGGLKKDVGRSATPRGGSRLDRAIVVILALAVAYFAFDKFVLSNNEHAMTAEGPDSAGIEKSVVVLPFEALSSGEDDGYFADGLTDEIIVALDQLQALQVSTRMSSFSFRDRKPDLSEIAERLNVNYVVQGSVRRSGNDIRISAQLARIPDGVNVWSQNYATAQENVLDVQQEIAEKIAESLGVALDENSRRIMHTAGIGDVEAFIAFQKGLEAYSDAHLDQARASELLAVANSYFDRALEAAPDLSMARVVRADALAHLIFELAAGLREESFSGESQAVLATLRSEYDAAWRLTPAGNQRDIVNVEKTLFSDDWTALPALLQKATQPGECPQMNWTAEFVAAYGWADQIVKKYRESLACNPGDRVSGFHLPYVLLTTGDADAAVKAAEDLQQSGNTHPWLEDVRFWALLAAGRVNDPLAAGPRPPGSVMLYPRDLLRQALAGNTVKARELAAERINMPGADRWTSLMVSAISGDRQRANEFAAAADGEPGGIIVLSLAVFTCFCGAPFDLEATPNYKARIEEAGFAWPPRKIIDYPVKNW